MFSVRATWSPLTQTSARVAIPSGEAATSRAHRRSGSGTTSPRRRSRGAGDVGRAGGCQRLSGGPGHRGRDPVELPERDGSTVERGAAVRARSARTRSGARARSDMKLGRRRRRSASSQADSISDIASRQRRSACPAAPGRARTRVPSLSWRRSGRPRLRQTSLVAPPGRLPPSCLPGRRPASAT